MATMNVPLPEPMKDWVQEQVETGRYANVSDYVRDLIRHDQERRDALVRALIEGEESGFSDRSLEEIIAEARAEMRDA